MIIIAPRFKDKGRGGVKLGTPKAQITREKQRRAYLANQKKKTEKIKTSPSLKLHGNAFFEAWDKTWKLKPISINITTIIV